MSTKHTKHTPGTWFIGRRSDNGWHTVRVVDAGCTHGRVVAETIEADDARLIAEAPAMVEALRLVMAMANGDEAECDDNGDEVCPFGAVRAVLARIDGEDVA